MNPDEAMGHGPHGKKPPLMKRLLFFERRQQPLMSQAAFRDRLIRNAAAAGVMLGVSLVIGTMGYHLTSQEADTGTRLGMIESFYNASMILTGMGPADVRPNIPPAEMVFASFYALFSGVVFLVSMGVLLAPVVHRAVHHFNLEVEETEDEIEEKSSRKP
jgi:hypothetical protein